MTCDVVYRDEESKLRYIVIELALNEDASEMFLLAAATMELHRENVSFDYVVRVSQTQTFLKGERHGDSRTDRRIGD